MILTKRSLYSWMLLPLLGSLLIGLLYSSEANAAPTRLEVRSAILMDASDGKILYEQNPDIKIPPASLTKVLSMMVALDQIKTGNISLNDTVRASRYAANQSGSRMHLRTGERLPLNRLLMGMAVSSGNDASVAVAEHVGGSSAKFVKMMNTKARQIGMTNSRFKNPNGLPAPGQLTTARDMARLAYAYLRQHPDALRYHQMQTLRHNGRVTTNKNPLLGVFPGADGLKTGWVSASGYNIISTVRQGNIRLIAVVLGAENSTIRGVEVARMIAAGFDAQKKNTSINNALASVKLPAYVQMPSPGAKKIVAPSNKQKRPKATAAASSEKKKPSVKSKKASQAPKKQAVSRNKEKSSKNKTQAANRPPKRG